LSSRVRHKGGSAYEKRSGYGGKNEHTTQASCHRDASSSLERVARRNPSTRALAEGFLSLTPSNG